MATEIPKLEYKNGTIVGNTTSGSGTISGFSDTSDLEAGMFVEGTGIPSGSEILSVGADYIVLASSVVCTATGTSITISYGFRIQFSYPPKEPKGEAYDSNSTVSESLSGIRQVSTNHIKGIRSLIFSFLTQAIYTKLDTFISTWGLLGESFRYYEDYTSSTYVEYELETLKTDPKKIASRGLATYVWEVPLKFRRII